MKVKEAVEYLTLNRIPGTDIREVELARLYHDELMKRSNIRWLSGKIPMAGFCTLLKEMNAWIVKVMLGVGLTKGRAHYLMHTFNEQAYNSAEQALTLASNDR